MRKAWIATVLVGAGGSATDCLEAVQKFEESIVRGGRSSSLVDVAAMQEIATYFKDNARSLGASGLSWCGPIMEAARKSLRMKDYETAFNYVRMTQVQ
jgi:hypothetical protein